MNKKAYVIMTLVLSISLIVAACSKDAGNKTSDGTGPYKISLALMGGPKTPDSWVNKALEKDLTENLGRDIQVEDVFLPSWDDAKTKINLLMSDKKEMPDVMWHWDMNKEFDSWVKAGAVVDLVPYLQKYGQNIINYYSKETMFYHWDPSGKIFRLPGDISEPGTMTTIIRKDWLDNLGLEVPKTLDEYIKVLRAFTKDDPDGNGKDDTYGFAGENSYRTLAPFFYSHGVDPEAFMIQEDGTVKFGATMPQVKQVLAIVRGLYEEGIMDPRMVAPIDGAQVDDIMANGKIGSIYRWVAFFNPDATTHQSFKALNPEGEYMPIEPIIGPNGFASDIPSDEIGWSFLSVTAAAKEPDTAVKVLNRMASSETNKLIRFGEEGEHYEIIDGQYKSKIGPEEKNKLGLGNYSWYITRKDEANIENIPEVIELFNKRAETAMPMREKIVFFKSLERPAWIEYSADVKKLRDETFWGIIAGELPLDAFDDFVAKYPEMGGKEIDEEANKLYAEQDQQYEEFSKWYDENIESYK
ncbi:extracellular solute-binding protein [Lederbergia wuyishanensis]|uniref:ABC-type glycerol-3-phosphate transport system substrate-binding protein n=1 Tax=Lederbergia wuyishanensis TaxID=1347903 RepID=A0ABU0D338_9BACI|nr:extracellular solute-binding protein [Lederbergia wuyishanensis]MCJ8008010.1 extracellular solute-binding protein [Lederbergia wuyishanensis]MDQ0342819.1 ABC-type glycerol-3-phosphate transport system substrate-binding protein [Lederbergia wuyishanensis]